MNLDLGSRPRPPCYHSGPPRTGFTREVFPMFDGLQDKLQDVFRQLKGEGKVTPEALDAALRQIRMALLEADVHLRVVKPFIDRVRERALGAGGPREPHAGAAGGQDRARRAELRCSARRGPSCALDGRPTVIMLCGLQGSGKTTTAGKLAKRLKKRGKHPLLVAGDLQRAAAVEQLKQVGQGRRGAGARARAGRERARPRRPRPHRRPRARPRRGHHGHRRPPARRRRR